MKHNDKCVTMVSRFYIIVCKVTGFSAGDSDDFGTDDFMNDDSPDDDYFNYDLGSATPVGTVLKDFFSSIDFNDQPVIPTLRTILINV